MVWMWCTLYLIFLQSKLIPQSLDWFFPHYYIVLVFLYRPFNSSLHWILLIISRNSKILSIYSRASPFFAFVVTNPFHAENKLQIMTCTVVKGGYKNFFFSLLSAIFIRRKKSWHKVTRIWSVLLFLQISHASTYQ